MLWGELQLGSIVKRADGVWYLVVEHRNEKVLLLWMMSDGKLGDTDASQDFPVDARFTVWIPT